MSELEKTKIELLNLQAKYNNMYSYAQRLENENTELKQQIAITKEKIIKVLKDYYYEDEEDIKLFNKIASEILEDNK